MKESLKPVHFLGIWLFLGLLIVFLSSQSVIVWAMASMLLAFFLLGFFNEISFRLASSLLIGFPILHLLSVFLHQIDFMNGSIFLNMLTGLVFLFVIFKNLSNVLKITFALAMLVGVVGAMVFILSSQSKPQIRLDFQQDSLVQKRPNDKLVKNELVWKPLTGNLHKENFEIWENDFLAAQKHRTELPIQTWNSFDDYWRQVYIQLILNDYDMLDPICVMFRNLKEKQQLNRLQLAQTIIGAVQEMPYILLHRNSCQEFREESPYNEQLHQENMCKENFAFGIFSPAEMVYHLKGDCDSRTVLAFAILSKLGYQTLILNSEHYGHSLIGVELPAYGTYKEHQGKKYYVWETTATGWDIGAIDPSMRKLSYWNVILAN